VLQNLIVLTFSLLFVGASAFAETPILPHIHRVGVIPLQWRVDGTASEAMEKFEAEFAQAVRRSERFRVLNDELVADLWNSPEGRKELIDQFEIDGYVSLVAELQGDIWNLEARLLGQNLETYLLETERVPTDTVDDFRAQAGILDHLLFRMFNRLPVDVTVTSVQGIYVTLSGGTSQGVHNGDELKVVRPHVKSTHAANGTWIDYLSKPLGKVQVLDSKVTTAVAKIVEQNYDGAIRAGDGAKIAQIPGRLKFNQRVKTKTFDNAKPQGTIVVPPLYQGDGSRPADTPKPAAPAPRKAPETGEEGEPVESETLAVPTDEAPADAPAAVEATPPTSISDLNPGAQTGASNPDSSDQVTNIRIETGAYMWTVKGPTSAAAKFPAMLLNNINAIGTKKLFGNVILDLGLGGSFGSTKKGVFVGYRGLGRIYGQFPLHVGVAELDRWWVGGFGTVSGLQVTDEIYGGGDGVRAGVFAGIGGKILPEVSWEGEFALFPLHIGRFGYAGSQQNVDSTFGWSARAVGYYDQEFSGFTFGGGLQLAEESLSLDDSTRPKISETHILLLGKYAFK
jgi:hypothetical protein